MHDSQDIAISVRPIAVIVGATRAQLRSFGIAIERAGYHIVVLLNAKDMDGHPSVSQASLLVCNRDLNAEVIWQSYQSLDAPPVLVLLDGALALPSNGFRIEDQILCESEALELILRRHLQTMPPPTPPRPPSAATGEARSSQPDTSRAGSKAEGADASTSRSFRGDGQNAAPRQGNRGDGASDPRRSSSPRDQAGTARSAPKSAQVPPQSPGSTSPGAYGNVAGRRSTSASASTTTTSPSSGRLPTVEAPNRKQIGGLQPEADQQSDARRLLPDGVAADAKAAASSTVVAQAPTKIWRTPMFWISLVPSLTAVFLVVLWQLGLFSVSQSAAQAPAGAGQVPTAQVTLVPTSSSVSLVGRPPPISPPAPVDGTDLIAYIVQVVPDNPTAGEPFNIRVAVYNNGTQPIATPFAVELVLSPPQPPSVNQLLSEDEGHHATWWVEGLGAGERRTLETIYAPMTNLQIVPASGPQQVYVLVDAQGPSDAGAVEEQNERNNLTGPFEFAVAP